jgi:hypothetical protein
MIAYLRRLFDLNLREYYVLQAEQEIADSYALLKDEWERLGNCAARMDEVLKQADQQQKRCEFTDADKVIAHGFGVEL